MNPSMTDRKQLHDLLLTQMPEGVSHETCSLCIAPTKSPEGGTQVDKTYTEEDLQTAVAEATAELAAKVTALESAALESEVTAAVNAVKAETAAEIEDLRSKLDNAVLAAQSSKNELDTFKAELDELAAAEETAREIAARMEERLAKVKEFPFTDDYIEANAERFAAMSDEDFEARLADWSVMGTSKMGDSIPKVTALTAAREDTNSHSGMGLIRETLRGSLTGTDLRNL